MMKRRSQTRGRRAARRRPGPAGGGLMSPDAPCPSPEILRRSLDPDDPMPEPERQRIEAHVDCCSGSCKQAIDALLRGGTLPVGLGTAGPFNAVGAVQSESPARLGGYRIAGKPGSD